MYAQNDYYFFIYTHCIGYTAAATGNNILQYIGNMLNIVPIQVVTVVNTNINNTRESARSRQSKDLRYLYNIII